VHDGQPEASAAATVSATTVATAAATVAAEMAATAPVPAEMAGIVPAVIEGMTGMVEAMTEGMLVAKAVVEVVMEAAAEAAAAVIEIELPVGTRAVIIICGIAVVGGLAGAGRENKRGAEDYDDRRDPCTAARHATSIGRFGPSLLRVAEDLSASRIWGSRLHPRPADSAWLARAGRVAS
jgi:hypothetical protein